MLVTVERAFLIAGQRVEPGSTVDLDGQLAREMVAYGKARWADAAPAGAGPMTIDNAAALVSGVKPARKAAAAKEQAP